VIFLDTVHHFSETYAYRDSLASQWDLNVLTLRAERPVPASGDATPTRAAIDTKSRRCSAR
jgi:3'-phosphoadenosine 5'-phosphosulfate sulfotransferase (PAPS reductase)/FAD synthetase